MSVCTHILHILYTFICVYYLHIHCFKKITDINKIFFVCFWFQFLIAGKYGVTIYVTLEGAYVRGYFHHDGLKQTNKKSFQFHPPRFPTFCSKAPFEKSLSPRNATTTSEQVFKTWAWGMIIWLLFGRHDEMCFHQERSQWTDQRSDSTQVEISEPLRFFWSFYGSIGERLHSGLWQTGSSSSPRPEWQLRRVTSLMLPKQHTEVSAVKFSNTGLLHFF